MYSEREIDDLRRQLKGLERQLDRLARLEHGSGGVGGAVDSVNGQTGVVVLDADDIDDTATTNKFATAAELTKLAGIEALADVTDAGNVGAVNAAASSKNPPIDADSLPIVDSAASNVIKRVTFTNLKAFLKTYFDTLHGSLATINTWALVQTFTSGINLGNTNLTNYTQGTWTPVATFGGSTSGVTYSLQSGTYTRIGNRCFCTLHMALTNNGSGSGAFEITGLPFASSQQSAFPVLWGTSSTSFVNVMVIILSGTTTIGMYRITAAAASFTQMSDVEAGNTIGLNVEFVYRVA
jgi:hypothetical protein